MFKLLVKNLNGDTLHAPTFATMEELNEHKTHVESEANPWNFPTHEVDAQRENDIVDADGNVTGKTIQYYKKIVPHVTCEVVDIGDGKSAVERRLAKQEAGKKVLAFIAELNLSKNLTVEQYEAMLVDADLGKIERLLQLGALDLAAGAITTYAGDKYTSGEKAQILAALAVEVAAL